MLQTLAVLLYLATNTASLSPPLSRSTSNLPSTVNSYSLLSNPKSLPRINLPISLIPLPTLCTASPCAFSTTLL